jgi:hypothetical protein
MTNSSAVIFVSGGIPFEKLPSYMQEQQRGLHEYWLKNPDAYRRAFHGREYRGHAEEPLSLSSIAISIYSDFEVGSLPLENGPAPVVVVFPDFRRLGHISTFETVGHGVAGATFRFARCEAKRD